jgi:hypothetical protein
MAQYYAPFQHLDGFVYNESQGITYIKSSLMVWLKSGETIQLQQPVAVNPVSFYVALNVVTDSNLQTDHWWSGECLIPIISGALYNPNTTPPASKATIIRLAINQKLSYNNANYFAAIAEVFDLEGQPGGTNTNTINGSAGVEII